MVANQDACKLSLAELLRWVLVSLSLYCPARAQITPADSSKFSQELIAIEQQLMNAIPAGNATAWDRYLHPRFFIVTEDGTRLERAAFLATMKPLPRGYSGYINVIQPKLIFGPDIAVIQYVSDEYEFVFGQRLHTTYSSMNTYLKQATGWKMITSQVFEVPGLPLAIPLPASQLKPYVGTYALSDSVSCQVSLENDTLYLQKKGRAKEALLAETETVFFRSADARGRKLFVRGPGGTMRMIERRNGQDVVWKHH